MAAESVTAFESCRLQNNLYNYGMNTSTGRLDELLAQLKDMLPMLKQQYHVQTLEVFGSFVRGDERKNSDLDLLVTFDEVPTLFKFVALENDISDALGVKVDLVMKDSLKPKIGKRILEEAQPI
jgi:predicted nucleotidyltransferase